MKTRSILARAFGLLLLASCWPAWAAPPEGGTTPRGPRHGDRAATARPAQTDANASANATATSEGGVGVGSQGQSMNIDSHSRGAASSAIGPALTGSNDTCMGSTSIGAAGLAFGVSFGSTYTDDNCMMLKNARELWNMGFRGAAIARMCMDVRNRQALEATGVVCPAQVSERARRAPEGPAQRDPAVEPARQESSLREAVSTSAQPERFVR